MGTNFGPMAIEYVGEKAIKTDTVNKSGVVWRGKGDVQLVDHQHAVKLLAFPAVWRASTEKAAIEAAKNITTLAPVTLASNQQDESQDETEKGDPPDPNEGDDPALTGEGGANTGEGGGDEPATIDEIVDAISALEPGNKAHFTDKGNPKIAAVKELVGKPVVTKDFNTAWKQVGS